MQTVAMRQVSPITTSPIATGTFTTNNVFVLQGLPIIPNIVIAQYNAWNNGWPNIIDTGWTFVDSYNGAGNFYDLTHLPGNPQTQMGLVLGAKHPGNDITHSHTNFVTFWKGPP